jgi:hypothetical protein
VRILVLAAIGLAGHRWLAPEGVGRTRQYIGNSRRAVKSRRRRLLGAAFGRALAAAPIFAASR